MGTPDSAFCQPFNHHIGAEIWGTRVPQIFLFLVILQIPLKDLNVDDESPSILSTSELLC